MPANSTSAAMPDGWVEVFALGARALPLSGGGWARDEGRRQQSFQGEVDALLAYILAEEDFQGTTSLDRPYIQREVRP
jgi:hypothetical protein